MTATTTEAARPGVAPTRNEGRTSRISMTTLIRVELRKLADTRAGMWLLIIIAVASAATAVILLTAGDPPEQTYYNFFTFGLLPAAILLPVLGILSMTGEWTQRTALSTFTLVPARGRVLTAKLVAGLIVAVLATVAAAATGALGNLVAIALDGDGTWSMDETVPWQGLLLAVLYVLMGSAFGALLMNSAVAIVLFFAVPLVWSILAEMITGLTKTMSWFDINTTTEPLGGGDALTSGEWQKLGVAATVWVVLPLILGLIRMLRREVS